MNPALTNVCTDKMNNQTNDQTEDRVDKVKVRGALRPVAIALTADIGSAVGIFHRLARNSRQAFLFESTEGDGRLARYSFLAVDPALSVAFIDGKAITVDNAGGTRTEEPLGNPLAFLRRKLHEHFFADHLDVGQSGDIAELPPADPLVGDGDKRLAGFSPADPLVPDGDKEGAAFFEKFKDLPFIGGFAGYMGYGAIDYLEPIKKQAVDPFCVPDACYGLYESLIVFDHQFHSATIISLRGEEEAQSLLNKIITPEHLKPLSLDVTALNHEDIFADCASPYAKEQFLTLVEKTKSFISEGQAFQIVLSQRFSMPSPANPIDVYRILQATNPSPYAYFLKFPDFVYLGSSPETFVRCENGNVMLRAIAGTRPRGVSKANDEALASELKGDEKEMAEHRMLVDLGRNDLGRVSMPGSVKVGELACVTKYAHVMHLSTEINGQLKNNLDSFDAFASCFPAGTVSGAPKIRAMQLLSELECERRGIYSGSVGYFDLRGNADGAIAIRSALIKDGTAHVNAGGGIVYDSVAESEYQEARNKAKSVLQAIKLAARLKA